MQQAYFHLYLFFKPSGWLRVVSYAAMTQKGTTFAIAIARHASSLFLITRALKYAKMAMQPPPMLEQSQHHELLEEAQKQAALNQELRHACAQCFARHACFRCSVCK